MVDEGIILFVISDHTTRAMVPLSTLTSGLVSTSVSVRWTSRLPTASRRSRQSNAAYRARRPEELKAARQRAARAVDGLHKAVAAIRTKRRGSGEHILRCDEHETSGVCGACAGTGRMTDKRWDEWGRIAHLRNPLTWDPQTGDWAKPADEESRQALRDAIELEASDGVR